MTDNLNQFLLETKDLGSCILAINMFWDLVQDPHINHILLYRTLTYNLMLEYISLNSQLCVVKNISDNQFIEYAHKTVYYIESGNFGYVPYGLYLYYSKINPYLLKFMVSLPEGET